MIAYSVATEPRAIRGLRESPLKAEASIYRPGRSNFITVCVLVLAVEVNRATQPGVKADRGFDGRPAEGRVERTLIGRDGVRAQKLVSSRDGNERFEDLIAAVEPVPGSEAYSSSE